MKVRFATTDEIDNWDNLILSNPDGGNILQSTEFTRQKSLGGWRARHIMAGKLAITVFEKSIAGLGSLWYVIKGPGVTSSGQLAKFTPQLKQFASSHGVFMIKIEPEIEKSDPAIAKMRDLGYVKVANIQPNASTVLLDISGSLDDVMAGLNQKGRHAIRRAQRDGVVIKKVPSSNENCRIMFNLYKLTAEGQFGIRPYAYYKKFWQFFEKSHMGQMFFAYADGQVIASAYALTFGEKSVYKDGASLRERPVYGASHLLQWHVIEWAKEKGAKLHDFSGAPPSDQIRNPDHPYYGIGRFKTSFNKQVTDYIGTYDLVIKPTKYSIWSKIGERLAQRFSFWRKHENFY